MPMDGSSSSAAGPPARRNDPDVAAAREALRAELANTDSEGLPAFEVVDGETSALILQRSCTPGCSYRVVVRQLLANDDENFKLASLGAMVTLSRSESTDTTGRYRWSNATVDSVTSPF